MKSPIFPHWTANKARESRVSRLHYLFRLIRLWIMVGSVPDYWLVPKIRSTCYLHLNWLIFSIEIIIIFFLTYYRCHMITHDAILITCNSACAADASANLNVYVPLDSTVSSLNSICHVVALYVLSYFFLQNSRGYM